MYVIIVKIKNLQEQYRQLFRFLQELAVSNLGVTVEGSRCL